MDWAAIRPGEIISGLSFLTGGVIAATTGWMVMKGSIQLLTQEMRLFKESCTSETRAFKELYASETKSQNEKIDDQGKKIDTMTKLFESNAAHEERFKAIDIRQNGVQQALLDIRDEIKESRKEVKELRHWEGFVGPIPVRVGT